MTGTALAQVISVAVAPLLSRLYAPSAFGVFGVYALIVGIIGSVVTLRYDQAIILPKKNEDAANLLAISIIAVMALTAVTLLICLLLGAQIVSLMKSPDLASWLWVLPVSVFAFGLNQSLNSWCTRQKKFHRASISQVTRSVSMVVTQVSAGIKNASALGLIGGAVIGDICANAALATQVIKEDKKIVIESLDSLKMKNLALKYLDFPVYSSTQNLLNAVSQNIPVLLLSYFFSTTVVGYYALGIRLLLLPMNLVRTSLRQVLFQKATEVYNNGGNTYLLFKKITGSLVFIAIIPSLVLFFFAPQIFSFVLGDRWITAGEYARWLIFWLSIAFVNVPAMIFAQVYRKQKKLLIQDALLLVCRCLALLFGGMFLNALETIVLYSIVGMLFNLYIIFWMGNYLKNNSARVLVEH